MLTCPGWDQKKTPGPCLLQRCWVIPPSVVSSWVFTGFLPPSFQVDTWQNCNGKGTWGWRILGAQVFTLQSVIPAGTGRSLHQPRTKPHTACVTAELPLSSSFQPGDTAPAGVEGRGRMGSAALQRAWGLAAMGLSQRKAAQRFLGHRIA